MDSRNASGFPVGRDALQLIAEAARLGLRQDHLLGEVGQHRDDSGTNLALHAFEHAAQPVQVVIQEFGRLRGLAIDHQTKTLSLFHQCSDARTPLVEQRDQAHAFLAEELDRQGCLVRAIGHVGELVSQIEQDLLGRTDLARRINGRNAKRLQGRAPLFALNLGVEHGDRQALQAFDQALQISVGHLGHIGQCRQGFDRDSGFLGQIGQLIGSIGHRQHQSSDTDACGGDTGTSDQTGRTEFAQHRSQ